MSDSATTETSYTLDMVAELKWLHEQIAAAEAGEYVDWSNNLVRIQQVLSRVEGHN